jgi:hypothetical protein
VVVLVVVELEVTDQVVPVVPEVIELLVMAQVHYKEIVYF